MSGTELSLRLSSLDYLGLVASRLRRDAVQSKLKQDTIDTIISSVKVDIVLRLTQCFGSGSAWIRIKICLLDPDPHGQMRIRIQEVKKPRKYTGSLGEYRTGKIKVRILL